MSRRPNTTPADDAAMAERKRRGATYETCGKPYGLNRSSAKRAIDRHLARERKAQALSSAKIVPVGQNEAEIELVNASDPQFLLKQIARVDRLIEREEALENTSAVSSLMTRLVALLEHARRVAPPPKLDPNDDPDMIALGDQVWERLQKKFGVYIDDDRTQATEPAKAMP